MAKRFKLKVISSRHGAANVGVGTEYAATAWDLHCRRSLRRFDNLPLPQVWCGRQLSAQDASRDLWSECTFTGGVASDCELSAWLGHVQSMRREMGQPSAEGCGWLTASRSRLEIYWGRPPGWGRRDRVRFQSGPEEDPKSEAERRAPKTASDFTSTALADIATVVAIASCCSGIK